MFGCFPVGGFGFRSCCNFVPCGFARPIIPFGGFVAPFGGFACQTIVGNPFINFQNPLYPDNNSVRHLIFQKLGLMA